jgi:CRISPR/Cas system CMR subunit Cmr6 (Cas7 group RAMP superfamily)
MNKFVSILTNTGDSLIKKRAENVSNETKEVFEDEKRRIEKRIRTLKNEIISMEDLSVKSTQSLIVGENLNTVNWVKKRIDYELELRDLAVELETVTKLIDEYFSESSGIQEVLDNL